MPTVELGDAGLGVHKNGFGALSVPRVVQDDAVRLKADDDDFQTV